MAPQAQSQIRAARKQVNCSPSQPKVSRRGVSALIWIRTYEQSDAPLEKAARYLAPYDDDVDLPPSSMLTPSFRVAVAFPTMASPSTLRVMPFFWR